MKEYFPCHVRLKIFVLDLIMGLEDALVATANQWAEPKKAANFILNISTHRKGCFSHLPLEDGKLILSRVQYQQYKVRMDLLRKAMGMFYPKAVDAREFLSVCVIAALAVDSSLGKTNRPNVDERLCWNSLISTMDDLYSSYDPDLTACQQMRRGEQIAEVLLKIINGG